MVSYSRSESEKARPDDTPSTADSHSEINEADDIVAPLSPIKTIHRRPSLGIYSHYGINVDESINAPPSFAESQFATIIRRQRPRDTALKISNVPTRYPNLPRDFEFAGYLFTEVN